ncbi:MAG: DUF72 domain-containing protein [Acidobacteriota bacterium]
MPDDQLSLFGRDSGDHSRPRRAGAWPSPGSALEQRYERFRVLAAGLPPNLYMGTSSWSFPGWQGIVYPRKRSAAVLAKDGLREYAQHPLLRTVGIDRSYYAPVPEQDLRHYAEQLPDDFPCCAKAPAAVTAPTLQGMGRHTANPSFLSVPRVLDELIEPFMRGFTRHCGPFIFQFSPPPAGSHHTDATPFIEALDRFLEPLPRQFRYAVEIRDKWALTDAYRDVLARHGCAHVYNYWSAMPLPAAQARTIVPDSQPFVVLRLLLRPGARYEDQRQVFAPFDKLVEPDETMRRDVLDIVGRAATGTRQVFVLVNNKAEGSSPLTIEALAERLVAQRRPRTP